MPAPSFAGNAAYHGGIAGFGHLDLNAFDRTIRTNLFGCFFGIAARFA